MNIKITDDIQFEIADKAQQLALARARLFRALKDKLVAEWARDEKANLLITGGQVTGANDMQRKASLAILLEDQDLAMNAAILAYERARAIYDIAAVTYSAVEKMAELP